MKKQVEFTDLTDLLDKLEEKPALYQSTMLNDEAVLIGGNVYIRCYPSIDPENTSEQYYISANGTEYKILSNNKIWIKEPKSRYIQANYSEEDAAYIWYQVANIHQETIHKNFKKFHSRQQRWWIIITLTSTFSAILGCNLGNVIDNKIQDKKQDKKETPVSPPKIQIKPLDTIMYNATQQTR